MQKYSIFLFGLLIVVTSKTAQLEKEMGVLALGEGQSGISINPYDPGISHEDLARFNHSLDELCEKQREAFLKRNWPVAHNAQEIMQSFLSTPPIVSTPDEDDNPKEFFFSAEIKERLLKDRESFSKYFNEPIDSESKNKDVDEIVTNLTKATEIGLTDKGKDMKFTEFTNPIMRENERDFAAFIFKHYLSRKPSSNWILNVFNKGKLSSSSRLSKIFNLLSFEGPGNSIDQENNFFVRNFELFELFYAYLDRDPIKLKKAYIRYQTVIHITGWDPYEFPGGYFGIN